MSEKAFLNLLKDLSEPNKDIDIKEINEFIDNNFDKKEFTTKRDKNYFIKLVPYYLGIIANNNLEKALNQLDIIYKKLYTNNKTLDSVFTKQIRNPISKRFGKKSEQHKLSLKLAKLSYKDKGIVLAEAKSNLLDKHSEITRYDTKEIISIINNGIESENVYEKAVALALCCGARPIELFNENVKFTIINEHWVNQDFVAKKRDKIVPVDKPIIGISSKKFIEQLDDMRWFIKSDVKKVINRDGTLNPKIEDAANKTTKKLFGYADGITFYSCRKIYGNLSFELYSKDSKYGKDPSLNLWLSKVLGHGETDINTANHYSTFKSTSTEVTPVVISELQAKVAHLEKIIEGKSSIEVTKPILVGIKESKRNEQFTLVKQIYDSQTTKPNQTQLEVLMKDKVPRSVVRLWFSQNK